MRKITKQLFGILAAVSITGISIFNSRDSLYKNSDSPFYRYDHENYRFSDKNKNGELARVRMVEYPNLEFPIKNLFESVYVQYDRTGEKVNSGNFVTTNERIIHVTSKNYIVERIIDK